MKTHPPVLAWALPHQEHRRYCQEPGTCFCLYSSPQPDRHGTCFPTALHLWVLGHKCLSDPHLGVPSSHFRKHFPPRWLIPSVNISHRSCSSLPPMPQGFIWIYLLWSCPVNHLKGAFLYDPHYLPHEESQHSTHLSSIPSLLQSLGPHEVLLMAVILLWLTLKVVMLIGFCTQSTNIR